MIATLLAVLTSGAGGGIVGAITGIFKQSQERKERVAMAELELKRDEAEYANAQAQRAHELVLLEKGAKIELDKIETEADMEIEVSHQETLGQAQIAEFKNLNTSSWMDNLRASVRPVLAYWFTFIFNVMLIWAFMEYSDQLTDSDGKDILLGLFGTLSFTVTGIVTFYYVTRRNSAPNL